MNQKLTRKQAILKMIHLLSGTLFFLLFLAFFFPIFRNVLNIGNITGMIFCAVMIFVTWGNTVFSKFVDTLKTTAAGKIIAAAVPVIFVIGIIYAGFVTSLIISANKTAPKQDCTVIVLGCQVRGSRPSLMLLERIESACEFLKENPEVPCIVTGGKGSDETISEAQCMYDYLVKMGISSDRIYIEDKAVNTVENISFSKKIIEENNLSKNTAIVTDIFHEYRASKIVKKANLNYGSVPADCVWYLLPTFYVRELIAITATFVGLA